MVCKEGVNGVDYSTRCGDRERMEEGLDECPLEGVSRLWGAVERDAIARFMGGIMYQRGWGFQDGLDGFLDRDK